MKQEGGADYIMAFKARIFYFSRKYVYLHSGYSFEFGPPAVRNILARVRPSLAQEVK